MKHSPVRVLLSLIENNVSASILENNMWNIAVNTYQLALKFVVVIMN